MTKIGVITEQGDLGLGYDVLTEKDQSVYKQKEKENKEKSDKNNKRN